MGVANEFFVSSIMNMPVEKMKRVFGLKRCLWSLLFIVCFSAFSFYLRFGKNDHEAIIPIAVLGSIFLIMMVVSATLISVDSEKVSIYGLVPMINKKVEIKISDIEKVVVDRQSKMVTITFYGETNTVLGSVESQFLEGKQFARVVKKLGIETVYYQGVYDESDTI